MATEPENLTAGLVKVGEVWDRVRPKDPANLKVGTITVEAVGLNWIVLRADHDGLTFVKFERMNRTEVRLMLEQYRQPAKAQPDPFG